MMWYKVHHGYLLSVQVSTELTEKYGCFMKKGIFLFVTGSLILMVYASVAIFAIQTCVCIRLIWTLHRCLFFFFCFVNIVALTDVEL